jgi:hypothetical protein
MSDGPDFLSKTHHQMAQAQLLGAVFRPDGTWTMAAGQPPLPSALADRLRVHRAAIVALIKEKAT